VALSPRPQQHHRRGAQRGRSRRAGGDRPRQLAVIRRQGGAGILRDLRAQPSGGGGRSRGPAPCRAVDRGNRPDRQWLFPRQARPGETDRGRRHPYTIIRATQFMEFLRGIADSSADGNIVKLPPILFQPIAADDVAAIVADVALAAARRHRRDRRPGTSAVQRNHRPLSEGGR